MMKTVIKLALVCSATVVSIVSFGQAVKTMKPTIGTPNNYSKQEQATWQKALDNYGDYDKYEN
jgi:hypothetical protein